MTLYNLHIGAKGQKGQGGTNGSNGSKGMKGTAGTNGQNGQAGTNGSKGMKGAGEHMLFFANSDKSIEANCMLVFEGKLLLSIL
jgi:hypothetical protein